METPGCSRPSSCCARKAHHGEEKPTVGYHPNRSRGKDPPRGTTHIPSEGSMDQPMSRGFNNTKRKKLAIKRLSGC